MDFVLPPTLPLPRFCRRDRARHALSEMIRPILAERRTVAADTTTSRGPLSMSLRCAKTAPDDALVGMALCTAFMG
jgi:sterol 14-demethylase